MREQRRRVRVREKRIRSRTERSAAGEGAGQLGQRGVRLLRILHELQWGSGGVGDAGLRRRPEISAVLSVSSCTGLTPAPRADGRQEITKGGGAGSVVLRVGRRPH